MLKERKIVNKILLWLFLILINSVMSEAAYALTFKSSMCYNSKGNAFIRLLCPDTYKIKTITAFTGISRNNVCAYSSWDCIIQEGSTDKCDDRQQCTVSVSHNDGKVALTCGAQQGEMKYFQVEYICQSDNKAKNLTVNDYSTVGPAVEDLPTLPNIPSNPEFTYKNPRGPTVPAEATEEDNAVMIAIICGSLVGVVVVCAVMATLIHRIKNRTYTNALYATRSLINPTLTQSSPDYPSRRPMPRSPSQRAKQTVKFSLDSRACNPKQQGQTNSEVSIKY
ncbi:unnamed protein product [Owenia fusiformis]|uniref:SUEL-type lectin domain-containing protein n=1 Tax=Owenia fusiformis TaxID=6347 RepID=A0A8S4PY01_OWEFU|nr:unnamed protein product [Owenia fusiformis]